MNGFDDAKNSSFPGFFSPLCLPSRLCRREQSVWKTRGGDRIALRRRNACEGAGISFPARIIPLFDPYKPTFPPPSHSLEMGNKRDAIPFQAHSEQGGSAGRVWDHKGDLGGGFP